MIVDIRHVSKWHCLLGVVKKDGVFRCHSEHQAIGQLEPVGQRLHRSILQKDRRAEIKKKKEKAKNYFILGRRLTFKLLGSELKVHRAASNSKRGFSRTGQVGYGSDANTHTHTHY